MKKVKLDINERLLIKNILSGVTGDLVVIKKALNSMEKIDIKEVEAKKVNLRIEDNTYLWEGKKDKEKEFEFEDADFDYLKETMNAKKDYPVDKRIINFLEKINSI